MQNPVRKKLLVTASTFPRFMGDTEPTFIYDLCKEYIKYYDVTVLVPGAPGAKDEEDMEGIHVIRYPYFPIRGLETLCYPGAIVPRIREKKTRGLLVPFLLLSLYRWLSKNLNNYDYVHCNWVIPQGIIHCLFNKKYILSGLGGDVSYFNSGPMYHWKKKVIHNASSMAVVSDEMKNFVAKTFGRNDTVVIPMGCSLEKFTPDNYRENAFNQNGKQVILFVGRLVEKKGTRYLIEAMKGIDAKLIIVGDGPEKEELVGLAQKTGADIEFVGSKNKDELAVMYASCDVYCSPSVIAKDGDKEGTPVSLEEAMASGAAVVGSNQTGTGEIIKDGINGLLFPPADSEALREKLKLMLTDGELREKCRKNALETAKDYDFVNIGLAYKKLIEKMGE